jgi:hypothetical protein
LFVAVGCGVSCSLVREEDKHKVCWEGFLDQLRQRIAQRLNVLVPDEAWDGSEVEYKANILRDFVDFKVPEEEYRASVSDILSPLTVKYFDLAEEIRRLCLPVATTNYDLLLGQALRFRSVDMTIDTEVLNEDVIFHVHGIWCNTKSIILSKDEYTATTETFRRIATQLLSAGARSVPKSFLFVGCCGGLVDDHFKSLYRVDSPFTIGHFALLSKADIDYLLGDRVFRRAVLSGKLCPLQYGDHHSCLVPFLRDMTSQLVTCVEN